jgi:hypothetical protein
MEPGGVKLGPAEPIFGSAFTATTWTIDLQTVRRHSAIHGASWLRGFKGEWRRANALFKSLLAAPPPNSVTAQLQLLDHLIAGQQAAADLTQDDELGRSAFGGRWRRDKSDWAPLRRTPFFSDIYNKCGEAHP